MCRLGHSEWETEWVLAGRELAYEKGRLSVRKAGEVGWGGLGQTPLWWRNQEDVCLQHLEFPVVKVVDVDTLIFLPPNAKDKYSDR